MALLITWAPFSFGGFPPLLLAAVSRGGMGVEEEEEGEMAPEWEGGPDCERVPWGTPSR